MQPLSGSPSLASAPSDLKALPAKRAEGPGVRDHKQGRLATRQPRAATTSPPPLSTRTPQVPAVPGMGAMAQAILAEEHRRLERLAANACALKLRKLGATLASPPPPLLVRSMADLVAHHLAGSRYYDGHPLVDVLVAALGGAATMEPATLRIVTERLLAATPRTGAPSLYSGMRTLCRLLGGPAMAPAHRQALLDAGMDVLAPLCQAHGLDPLDPAQRPVRTSALLLCSMTDDSLQGGDREAHLAAMTAYIVNPASPPTPPSPTRLQARAALLQGLCVALGQLHGPEPLGAAYLGLLQRAPAFDPALYEYATDRFVFTELFKDQPTPERTEARLRAFAQGVARWTLALDATAGYALMAGTCNSLFNDSPFTPAHFAALVNGALDVASHDRCESLMHLALGLVEPAAHRRQLDRGHVEALLAIAWALPARDGTSTRRELLLLALAHGLSRADWPSAPLRALVDGLLAHAPSQGPSGWLAAGVCLGRCLAPLQPTTRLFEQVLGRLAGQPDLATACVLVAGFFSIADIVPANAQEFEVMARVLAPRAAPDTWRSATLAAQFAAALGAHQEIAGSPRRLAPYFRAAGAARERKGEPDAKGLQAKALHDPLDLGLSLALDPVRTVRRAGGSASLQLERLDRACLVRDLFYADQLHQQVRQLAQEDFGTDLELRADMLATLFAHHASCALPKTLLAARAALLRDHARACEATATAPPRERLDGKGLAPATLAPGEHLQTVLDAIYRDYVTASSPFDPSPQLEERLRWIESVLDPTAGGIVPAWELALVSALRADYSHRMDPAQPGLLASPALD